jgi:hypothetical protein
MSIRYYSMSINRGDIVLYGDKAYYADKPVGSWIDLYDRSDKIGAKFYRRHQTHRNLVQLASPGTIVLSITTQAELDWDRDVALISNFVKKRDEKFQLASKRYKEKIFENIITGKNYNSDDSSSDD